MLKLKARVHKGRLKLDEPYDAPDGTEVDLAIIDEGDSLDDADRARLHKLISESHEQLERGEGIPADHVMRRLRSKRK